MKEETDSGYVPALRFAALTRVYDPVVRVTTREHRFRTQLLDHACVAVGDRALDLACGTGSLIELAHERTSGASFVGVDRDPSILDRASKKVPSTALVRGDATLLPFASASFDHVFATLMLHHLDGPALSAVVAEVKRVIRPGGLLHVADWRRGTNPLMRSAFTLVRLLDGFANTDRHARGTLGQILSNAGFRSASEWSVLSTPLGSIGLATASL